MFSNYLIIAWRNILRHKAYSLINISGVSLGLACCMLILLYAKDEWSFDRFHKYKDHLYQLTTTIKNKEGKEEYYALGYNIQGTTFKQDIPEIEACVHVKEDGFIVKKGNETFDEDVIWADENFFSVFSFPLLSGNPESVLKDIHSMVLTEEMAKKYFGNTDPIGKTLELELNDTFEPFTVTGIAKKSPQNSSIKFKIVLPYKYQEIKHPDDQWGNLGFPTYFLLHPDADAQVVKSKMAQVFASKGAKQIDDQNKEYGENNIYTFGIEPLTDMHLNTKYSGTPESSDPIYSYILSGIALFILLIACINFVNLTVAQSLKRAKEIGVRKVIGSQRKQLIIQFLGESFTTCLIAFIFAFAIAKAALPYFNTVADKQLALNYLFDYKLIIGLVTLFVLTSLAAGFYPAMVLSGFDPVKTLYNRFQFSSKNYLSKGLIVLQFSLATFMVISTFFIYHQFDFLIHKDLGYNDKNLVRVDVGQGDNRALMQVFKNEFANIPGIRQVASRFKWFWSTISRANGIDIPVTVDNIDEDYLPTLQIPILEGRNFSRDFPGDSLQSVLVNEAYVKAAGWKDGGIGKTVDFFNGKADHLIIVGIVKDHHYGSLKQNIKPQIFLAQPNMEYGRFFLRIDGDDKLSIVKEIENVFHRLMPYRPFKYDFVEDLNRERYDTEAKWKQIVAFGATLMIFISCIGLLGLTMLSIQRRMKEIGIRKVLGAGTFQITNLVVKNYLLLVSLAFIIAIPAAWMAINKWLSNFAYRIDIEWKVFALAAILTTLMAGLTVSFQAVKAAFANPVKSIRAD